VQSAGQARGPRAYDQYIRVEALAFDGFGRHAAILAVKRNPSRRFGARMSPDRNSRAKCVEKQNAYVFIFSNSRVSAGISSKMSPTMP
jgi:hypothetical protein